jgi:hypothetical protein
MIIINSSIGACVIVAAITFLLSHCIATIVGFCTKPLRSNDGGYTYRHTD